MEVDFDLLTSLSLDTPSTPSTTSTALNILDKGLLDVLFEVVACVDV